MVEEMEKDSATAAALDKAWVNSMKQRLETPGQQPWSGEPCIIYRVPQTIREGDEEAYEPKVLSIGPYHRGKSGLEAMEQHKWRYMRDHLSLNPEMSLDRYLVEMRAMEAKVRTCYSGNIQLQSNELVEMMLLDGCFIVQFFLKLKDSAFDFIFKAKEVEEPIFNTLWILPPVAHDMLLLENQLPFFIPQCLFELAVMPNQLRPSPVSLAELTFDFFNCLIPLNKETPPTPTGSIHHLLHLFHTHLIPTPRHLNSHTHQSQSLRKYFVTSFHSHHLPIVSMTPPSPPPPPSPPRRQQPTRRPKTIPCATELQEAGVKFKMTATSSFMDIMFSKGVMEIPPLHIYENTNSFFRNLIAFEQCYPNSKTHFTAYAMFMDSLINTTKDVALLNQNGIIQHGLGSDEEVARLFNRLCKGLNFYNSKSYLSGVYKEVKEYWETDWHKWRASLMRDYFSNPWAFLSLLAAIVLLLLAVAQTLLSAISYFVSPCQNCDRSVED